MALPQIRTPQSLDLQTVNTLLVQVNEALTQSRALGLNRELEDWLDEIRSHLGGVRASLERPAPPAGTEDGGQGGFVLLPVLLGLVAIPLALPLARMALGGLGAGVGSGFLAALAGFAAAATGSYLLVQSLRAKLGWIGAARMIDAVDRAILSQDLSAGAAGAAERPLVFESRWGLNGRTLRAEPAFTPLSSTAQSMTPRQIELAMLALSGQDRAISDSHFLLIGRLPRGATVGHTHFTDGGRLPYRDALKPSFIDLQAFRQHREAPGRALSRILGRRAGLFLGRLLTRPPLHYTVSEDGKARFYYRMLDDGRVEFWYREAGRPELHDFYQEEDFNLQAVMNNEDVLYRGRLVPGIGLIPAGVLDRDLEGLFPEGTDLRAELAEIYERVKPLQPTDSRQVPAYVRAVMVEFYHSTLGLEAVSQGLQKDLVGVYADPKVNAFLRDQLGIDVFDVEASIADARRTLEDQVRGVDQAELGRRLNAPNEALRTLWAAMEKAMDRPLPELPAGRLHIGFHDDLAGYLEATRPFRDDNAEYVHSASRDESMMALTRDGHYHIHVLRASSPDAQGRPMETPAMTYVRFAHEVAHVALLEADRTRDLQSLGAKENRGFFELIVDQLIVAAMENDPTGVAAVARLAMLDFAENTQRRALWLGQGLLERLASYLPREFRSDIYRLADSAGLMTLLRHYSSHPIPDLRLQDGSYAAVVIDTGSLDNELIGYLRQVLARDAEEHAGPQDQPRIRVAFAASNGEADARAVWDAVRRASPEIISALEARGQRPENSVLPGQFSAKSRLATARLPELVRRLGLFGADAVVRVRVVTKKPYLYILPEVVILGLEKAVSSFISRETVILIQA